MKDKLTRTAFIVAVLLVAGVLIVKGFVADKMEKKE